MLEQIISVFNNLGMVAELDGTRTITVTRSNVSIMKFAYFLFPQAITIVEGKIGVVVEENVGNQHTFSVYKNGLEAGKITCQKE